MSKLPHISTTIFTVMSKLANEHKAINLSQGFPNFPVDPVLIDILKKKADENVHQYMPMAGNPGLLSKVSVLIEKQYNRSVNPEKELLITAGATQAIFTIVQALVNPGDEVIVLDPSYDSYEPSITLAGGKALRIPLTNDFMPDWNAVSNAVGPNTRMIITNNPHNPSGRIWNESDFDNLERIMAYRPEMIWLSDEVYEFITFEQKHISAHHRKQLLDRSVVVSSFGKTFHITGWKIGYIAAPEPLMEEIKKVHQFNVFCVNSVAQAALAEYLDKTDVNVLGSFYQEKRDLFRSLLRDSRFRLLPCDGTYFQIADYSAISDLDDVEFCRELTIQHGVAAIPVSVFNEDKRDNKMIRFCFAKDNDTLIKAAELLCKI